MLNGRGWVLAWFLVPAAAAGSEYTRAQRLLGLVEPLVPDGRLEISTAPTDFVLSWPVHLNQWWLPVTEERSGFLLSAFAEVQYRSDTRAVRGVFGGRASYFVSFKWGVLLEAAGLVGTDGSGAVFGIGPSLPIAPWGPESAITFSLVARGVFTTRGSRFDITFDVMMPLSLLWVER